MRKRGDIAVDIISRIDDDVLEKNLLKRFELWFSRGKKPKNNKWIPIIAAAASLCLVVTVLFLIWPKAPVEQRQAPIYLGMTVSNKAPTTNMAMADVYDITPMPLASNELMLTPIYLNNTDGESSDINSGDVTNTDVTGADDTNTAAPPEISGGPYYAMPGEDIYIYVHISNPDEFEILSFTLNEVKYSAYMFVDGSDLETLILKCNVGEIEGVMQYTIDAIKYVDGEEIKDVKMEGDQTIEVMVGNAGSSLGFDISLVGFDVFLTPVWDEEYEGEREILSLAVYDGGKLIKEYSPDDRILSGLPNNSRFMLLATYKNGEEIETSRHIFDTRKLSEGLQMTGGVITGTGSCTDTVLYLNAPIADEAFLDNKYITEVHFGPGVTSIGNRAFVGCDGITEVSIPSTVTSWGTSSFNCCEKLTTVNIGASEIPFDTFSACRALTKVTLLDGVTEIGEGAFNECRGLEEIRLPNTLKRIDNGPFGYCFSLEYIYYGGTVEQWNEIEIANDDMAWNMYCPATYVQCSDGTVSIR